MEGDRYECHITTTTEHVEVATRIAQANGWKTSQIERDPILGDETFFYLTKYHIDFLAIGEEMMIMVNTLHIAGVKVLREKIEKIVHDRRYM
jgi:hypothetical protein